jgi:hypothetical protein
MKNQLVWVYIYSYWNLEGDRLTSLLSTMSGYHMSGRWKAVSSCRRWPPVMDKNAERPHPQRALHIECARNDKAEMVHFLESSYNTSFHREYPMVIKLRFSCAIRVATGLAMGQQCDHLHARQNAFNDILESRPVYALQDAYIFYTKSRKPLQAVLWQ